ncbi:MAG: helix-turn-helix domain-containing protein [Salinibacter sp.]|uniref:helix-turn-helix domain-containing protein n=1 Tax=Salinibacter sp. TaxID=2065818 RepID=UPI0035D49162
MRDQQSEAANDQIELPDGLPPAWTLLLAWLALTLIQAFREENKKLLEEHRKMEALLSIEEVADILGVSKRTVEDIVAAERLKPIWVKGQRRFHPDTVDAYQRSQARKDR